MKMGLLQEVFLKQGLLKLGICSMIQTEWQWVQSLGSSLTKIACQTLWCELFEGVV